MQASDLFDSPIGQATPFWRAVATEMARVADDMYWEILTGEKRMTDVQAADTAELVAEIERRLLAHKVKKIKRINKANGARLWITFGDEMIYFLTGAQLRQYCEMDGEVTKE